MTEDLRKTIESVFRQESGKIVAGLIRISGSFDLAEEAMQDAFASALSDWSELGLPDNPAGWITAVARRKLVDYARRERTRRDKQDALTYETPVAAWPSDLGVEADMLVSDDRLRLIFTCCHPALNEEAQVALTLRTLGGLTTPEIARAFLLSEPTLSQRLVRAKAKIQQARIPYEVPNADALPARLASVRKTIYLVFNEGYTATAGDSLVRRELSSEAIRLARVLHELIPDDPENTGLLALMLLHDSRQQARVNAEGELVTLEEQDRSLWKREQISEGLRLLDQALALHRAGPYQLQAAIAALHARAATPNDTDWREIAQLYERLYELQPSAVIALNHGVAIAMGVNLDDGLHAIERIGQSGQLDSYYLYHAARADILRRLNRKSEAYDAYRRALSLTANAVERRYLRRRIASLGS
jgi:RNA polymerase sigma-70 factor (ECF subfamily)